jgi:hypothetical protein
MFEFTNLEELKRLTLSILTPQVIEKGKSWTLESEMQRKIRHALFGARGATIGLASASIPEQREVLSQFTNEVVEPIIASLPAAASPLAVLILYQEFVDAVFIQPLWEADVGGAG